MVVFNDDIERNVRKEEAYTMGRTEGLESGIKSGIAQGISQGIAQNKREMIINMYKNRISNSIIAKCANVAVSEVERIINNATNNKLSRS